MTIFDFEMNHALIINSTLQNGTYRIEKVLGQGSFGITRNCQVHDTRQSWQNGCRSQSCHKGVLHERGERTQ